MPRFAANLSMLYNEHDFLDRFAAAAKDGFEAVEFLFPYAFAAAGPGASTARAWPAAGAVQRAARQLGRRRARHGLPARTRGDEFRRGVEQALSYATGAALPAHAPDGGPGAGAGRARGPAAPPMSPTWPGPPHRRAAHGVDVLIEPINTRDIPGFFLNRQDEAHAIVAEVGAANLKVQMDLYHCQIVEGDLAMKIAPATCPPARSATCRSPACPSATSPTSARSTTPICSS